MTPTHSDDRAPGTLVLTIARAIVDEPTFSTVVCPAVADVQQEVREARGGAARTAARVRGYWSLARLLLVLFVVPPVVARAPHELPQQRAAGGPALVILLAALFAATWPIFGPFSAFAAIGGVLFAITMRWWNDRHPATRIEVEPGRSGRPEINLSRIPVGGNAGGLIFAVGSVIIVILGLPGVRWFALAAIVNGVLLAAALFLWRRVHPVETKPGNSIAIR